MKEPPPSSLGQLPLPVLEHVDQLCERFEAAWKAGTPPRLAEYLDQAPNAGRAALLKELLRLDLEYRQQRGETPALQEYLDRLPDSSELVKQSWPTAMADENWLQASWAERKPTDTMLDRLHSLRDARAAHTPSAEIPVVAGYEIQKELAHGGMGVVYLARQTGLNRTVALKVLLAGGHAGAEELARFRTEAEAVAQLKHPHLVEVYDYGTFDLGSGKTCPFMALEYVDGGTLRERLLQGPMEQRDAAQIVAQLAHAIQYAHEHGTIHRDLKPANILLSFSRAPQARVSSLEETRACGIVPKITDLGLGQRLGEASEHTRTGQVLGTPSYMAPEQAAGHTKGVTTLADVYGLGAILYELLTGSPPFIGDTPLDIVLQVQTQPPTPPQVVNPKVDRDLEVICLKCLAKEPAARYVSARELALDLERWLAGEPIRARPPTPMALVRLWLKQNFGAAGWALLLGVVYGLAGAIQLFFAGPNWILNDRADVYRNFFPSLPLPWWSMDYVHPQWLRTICFFLTFLGTCSAGLLAYWIVRPRNRFAEIAAGLVIGASSGLVLFATAGGWYTIFIWSYGPEQDVWLLYRDAKATAAGKPPHQLILGAYPDLETRSEPDRVQALLRKRYADAHAVLPWAILYAMGLSLFVSMGVCVSGVLAASRAVREKGWSWRMLGTYYRFAAPPAFLVGLLYAGLLFVGNTKRDFLSRMAADAPVMAAILLVMVAQARSWPRRVEAVLHLLWIAALVIRFVGWPTF